MGFITDFLARRQANKLMRAMSNYAADAEREARIFSQAFKDSAWNKRFGKYPVSLLWADFAEQPVKPAQAHFPTVLDALLWCNRLGERFGLDRVKELNDDHLTNDEKIQIIWFSVTTGKALGMVSFLPNVVAEGKSQEWADEQAREAEALLYLREDADEEYFRELYLEMRGVLSGELVEITPEEREAALANPKIAHLVPKA
ncbi:TPA: hypothetical protein NPO92_000885 [Klebsiella quasipneumoniae subsp. quasipneumoniae]|nr:hypothetical protein [Klebsiella quasipneumoniae subsp. quasipneumoniae]